MEILTRMERILVIQTAFIGDAVLTLPMLQKLKENFPASAIDVVCIPSTEEIFNASDAVNEVLIMDKRGKHKSIINLFKFIKEIKDKNYTRIYSPHRSFRSSLIVMQSGVKETYGFDSSSMFHIYKHITKYKLEHHEVERNLELIGFDCSNDKWRIKPEIQVSAETQNKIDRYLLGNNLTRKLAAVAPGTIWSTKKYPAKYFSQVVNYLNKKDFEVLLIGSEKDRDICSSIAPDSKSGVKVAAGDLSIVETIELLKRCEILISNDSAPTHFGMAAGIKVLTIYCSTVHSFGFYPYNKYSSYISFDELDCKPCGIHGYDECPIKTFDCANKLTPEKITNKIEEMLIGIV